MMLIFQSKYTYHPLQNNMISHVNVNCPFTFVFEDQCKVVTKWNAEISFKFDNLLICSLYWSFYSLFVDLDYTFFCYFEFVDVFFLKSKYYLDFLIHQIQVYRKFIIPPNILGLPINLLLNSLFFIFKLFSKQSI